MIYRWRLKGVSLSTAKHENMSNLWDTSEVPARHGEAKEDSPLQLPCMTYLECDMVYSIDKKDPVVDTRHEVPTF